MMVKIVVVALVAMSQSFASEAPVVGSDAAVDARILRPSACFLTRPFTATVCETVSKDVDGDDYE